MGHKQALAARIMPETSMMARMAGTGACDADVCPRCSGLMVDERFYDFGGGRPFQGVRCVNCGEILDSLIRIHRYQRQDSTHQVGMSAGK